MSPDLPPETEHFKEGWEVPPPASLASSRQVTTDQWSDHRRCHIAGRGVPYAHRSVEGRATGHPWIPSAYWRLSKRDPGT
jgi:hypothetical protein